MKNIMQRLGQGFPNILFMFFQGATMPIISSLRHFLRSERGVTAIEYGILAAGLAVIIGTLVSKGGTFSTALDQIFTNIIGNLPTTATPR